MARVVDSFWKNKKVFLTGHTGFKGSWLSLWLTKMGAQVTGYALPPSTDPSLFEVAKIAQNMNSIFGDVRDLENLKKSLVAAQPEIVIHMAAQALVRYSYLNPVETYMTNVMGTVNLFEAVRSTPSIQVVINVTSDKCYENKEWQRGYREDDMLGGYDPYSNSKGCSELVTAAYRSSFLKEQNVAVASARAGNVIGGGDWAEDRLVPDIIRAVYEGHVVKIRNPRSIRPWQHVLVPLSGYLVLAQKMFEHGSTYAQAFNFGPDQDDAKEVEWIVKKITQVWGSDAQYELVPSATSMHEAHYLKLDCTKSKELLGWQSQISLDMALSSIVEWYLSYKNNPASAYETTLAQIKKFEPLL